MKSDCSDASPVKILLEELSSFRTTYRNTLDSLLAKMDKDLASITEKAKGLGDTDNLPSVTVRDIRDMLTLLRHLDVKHGKPKRKDLKKMDTVRDDLLMLTEKW